MDRVGQILVDTYRIERLIAEGGMGSVYEATHLRIPKRFAVKFLKVSLLDNTTALLRFRREAEVIATLEHPHIVNLLDYNITTDGVPYTVLEFLDGEHLGARLQRGRLTMAEALKIGDAMGGALATAHARGVIHRDLKPENVILCNTGNVKVVDFGIAKLRGSPELTAMNSILGTISYMAPEQLMAGTIDARTDLFALGAIFFEMLSGEMAFGGSEKIPELAEKVLRHDPGPIAGVAPAVSAALKKALAKEPDQRFASVDEFMHALHQAVPAVEPATALMTGAPASAAAAPEGTPTGPTVLPLPADGLPELPGDATTITQLPEDAERPAEGERANAPDAQTGEASLGPIPSEVTRITKATDSEAPAVRPEPGSTRITPSPLQLTPGVRSSTVKRSAAAITGRVRSLSSAFRSRRGVVIGAAVGLFIGVVLLLLLR
jgi:serine/threonine-protein kinase